MRSLGVCLLSLFLPGSGAAQVANFGGEVAALYQQSCAACHGDNWQGGRGGSLLKDRWEYVQGDEEKGLGDLIRDGTSDKAMPSFAGKLSDAQIRSLVILIEERRHFDRLQGRPPSMPEGPFTAGNVTFRFETVLESQESIWALAFLPDGRLVFTERQGLLRVVDLGRPDAITTIGGTPGVWGPGMMDVGVHPDFAKTGWIYLTYVEGRESPVGQGSGYLTVVRGRIREGQWVDQQRIFEVPKNAFSPVFDHFGSRIVFRDGFVYFSSGDRREQDTAQDLGNANGKIFRLFDDGQIPPDNPFVKDPKALGSIWSLGHRNPQGLVFRPGTGELWEAEHGPRGGDEINLIEPGRNYGWPVITHGMNDDGSPITSETARPGMEQPKHYWTPSIGVCAVEFYEGEKFPMWKGDLFAGGLNSGELHRLKVQGREIVADEIVMKGAARIRDVVNGPDGTLYLVLNSKRNRSSRIVRLVPVKP